MGRGRSERGREEHRGGAEEGGRQEDARKGEDTAGPALAPFDTKGRASQNKSALLGAKRQRSTALVLASLEGGRVEGGSRVFDFGEEDHDEHLVVFVHAVHAEAQILPSAEAIKDVHTRAALSRMDCSLLVRDSGIRALRFGSKRQGRRGEHARKRTDGDASVRSQES